VVGACSFKHPPDTRGEVEIAYFTFPGHERRGHATAMAGALLALAADQPDALLVVAHTLPERNASTRVLERSGFRFVGVVEDPEDGTVWRYERANEP
jgi:RimJ/RimL family protein N-acetyltransferase